MLSKLYSLLNHNNMINNVYNKNFLKIPKFFNFGCVMSMNCGKIQTLFSNFDNINASFILIIWFPDHYY